MGNYESLLLEVGGIGLGPPTDGDPSEWPFLAEMVPVGSGGYEFSFSKSRKYKIGHSESIVLESGGNRDRIRPQSDLPQNGRF